MNKFLLKYQKIIVSLLLSFIVLFFHLPKVDSGPVGGDTYQYWYLATHLSKTGNYGYLIEENNDKLDYFNPLNNGGIRRGEVLYPLLISFIINLTTTESELNNINSDCIYGINKGQCNELGGTSVLVNYLFIFLKMLIIFGLSLFIYEKIKIRNLIFIVILTSASFPYADKDMLTYTFLLIYFASYLNLFNKKTNLSFRYLSLSLLPLTNPIFFYYLFIHFLLIIFISFIKKDKMTISLILVMLSAVPSLVWSFRNSSVTNNFTITARGSETIGIRAEFLSIEYSEIPAGVVFYTPSSRISNIMKGYLWDKVGTENWEDKFSRQSKSALYRLGHSKSGYVYDKMKQNLGIQKNVDIDYEDIVASNGYNFATSSYRHASFDLIKENKLKYLGTSLMFLYRGLFPEFNQLNQEIKNTLFGDLVNEILLMLRFAPIIYCFYFLIRNFRVSIFDIQNYLFLFIYFSYGLLTHFIPRYSALLMPFAIYLLIKNNTSIKSIK